MMFRSPTAFIRAAIVLASTAWLAAQTPEPAIDPGLPDQLKELKSLVAEPKMTEDFRAIGLLQQLSKDPDKRNQKDVERLAKGIGDVFRTGRVRPADKDHLYREAGDALARLGADGGKELARALQDSRIKGREYVPLRAHLIVDLGRTKDEKQVDWLLEQATQSPHDELMAAGGEALGQYTDLEIRKRRDVVRALIRRYAELHGLATQLDPTDPAAPVNFGPQNARRTLRFVEGKWNATLTALTGQSFTSLPDWQRWLNKNPGWNPPGSLRKD